MKARILAGLTLVNSVSFCLMLIAFFELFDVVPWFEWFFVSAAIFNGLLLLVLIRHAHRNPIFSENQRNLWEILLFVAPPVSYPIYVWKFVLPRDV